MITTYYDIPTKPGDSSPECGYLELCYCDRPLEYFAYRKGSKWSRQNAYLEMMAFCERVDLDYPQEGKK